MDGWEVKAGENVRGRNNWVIVQKTKTFLLISLTTKLEQ